MELNDNVIHAFSEIFPELLPECEAAKIVAVCTPQEFRERLKEAENKDIIVLTDYILKQKNEFLQGIVNILVSVLAARIKEADTLYAVENLCLAKAYPHIVSANAVIFLDEAEGASFVENYNSEQDKKIALKTLTKEEIPAYFLTLTRFGIEFTELEPTLCRLRYKQKQLFKSEFDSISGCGINFLILKFLQTQAANNPPKLMKLLEAGMLAAIANNNFACMGMTINGSFEALLITDSRDGSKWIPCFTDTMEIQETYTTIPAIAKLLMSSQVVTMKFTELKRYMELEKVAGVVINIGGFGLRIGRDTCKKMINSAGKKN